MQQNIEIRVDEDGFSKILGAPIPKGVENGNTTQQTKSNDEVELSLGTKRTNPQVPDGVQNNNKEVYISRKRS